MQKRRKILIVNEQHKLTFSCESSPRTCTYSCNNFNLFEGCSKEKSVVCFPVSRLFIFEAERETLLEGLSCADASK